MTKSKDLVNVLRIPRRNRIRTISALVEENQLPGIVNPAFTPEYGDDGCAVSEENFDCADIVELWYVNIVIKILCCMYSMYDKTHLLQLKKNKG